ncbi:MAG: hypothetical protein MUE32_05120, partial [Bacteroidales bacterium]|nr:hypothetical protein [Bacteroidales bacterium]
MTTNDNLNKGASDNIPGMNSEKTRNIVERNAIKKGTEKGVLMTGIISLFIFIIAGIVLYSMYSRDKKEQIAMMEDQKTAYTEMLSARDSAINEWVTTFDQIERDLRTIKEKEKLIATSSADPEFSKDRKEQILKDIAYINALLEQNKKKIASLNDQLKKSGITIKGLQTKIAELEVTLKQSETEITGLKTALAEKDFQIEQLNTKMSDMEVNIAQKEDRIAYQTNELNKAFVASGTYKDLKEKGLVVKEGGFLGLGRKESLVENFPAGTFAQIDITQTKTI